MYALFVADHPEAEEMTRLGSALVNGSVKRVFQGWHLDFDRAELGRLRACRRRVLPVANLLGTATFQAFACCRVNRHAVWQRHPRALYGRGGETVRGFVLRNHQLGVDATWCRCF